MSNSEDRKYDEVTPWHIDTLFAAQYFSILVV